MVSWRRHVGPALLSLAVLLFSALLSAQDASTAAIRGAVTDATGARIPGAHVTLTDEATKVQRTAEADAKGGSSKWLGEQMREFSWQQGYGAFSIGISQMKATVAYIDGQEEHHRKVSFEDEFVAFLKKHDITYDPKYVLG